MNRQTAPSLKRTFAITAAALFMFALDRQVVANALASIQRELGASLQALEWTVSAYTLSFCVLLLAGAALGDRFGRRRMFNLGVAIFTTGSAASALAPSAGALIAARALQGVGGSLITPLSLTILAAATAAERRGKVLGMWGAVAGGAASVGPVLGGALTQTLSWHWIFWINVPIGLVLIPLSRRWLHETHGAAQALDLVGIALSAVGLLALVWSLIEVGRVGFSQPIVASLAAGAVGLLAFLAWERRCVAPMAPLRFFRSRAFAGAAAAALLAYFSFFGALFLVAQLLQVGLRASPLTAGLELLALTGAAVATAPVAGALCDRLGPRPLLIGSLAIEAIALVWLGILAAPAVGYGVIAPALALAGVAGAALFAPVQAALLAAVTPHEQGQASGLATVIRELGGVLGIAVLGAVFAANGSTSSPQQFISGFRPAPPPRAHPAKAPAGNRLTELTRAPTRKDLQR